MTCAVHALHHDAEYHHHHSHSEATRHPGNHHLLTVEDLSVSFEMYDPTQPFWCARRLRHEVLRDLTISVHEGEILAVVGASGSGKTVLADAILGHYEPNAQVSGAIWFDGERCDSSRLASLRGHGIAWVPQGVANLDPLMRVGEQVRGVPKGHTSRERAVDARRRLERQQALFDAFGLDRSVAQLYPHELSGGMARRILLMCALIEKPKLVIADEPTPGLDLDLAVRAVEDLRAFADGGGGVLLITHDLELAMRVADRIAVFKDGTVVEETDVASFFLPEKLARPYSRALWHAMPQNDFWGAIPADHAACRRG